jgi:integrase
MTKLVRYQVGCLYADHSAWFVKYRAPVKEKDGSIRVRQQAKMLGRLEDYPRESDILPLKIEFMQRLNAGKFSPDSTMNLTDFVEQVYLPYVEELRASTRKGYREIWTNHIADRVGHIRLREFRTVDASRMLKAIADENDLSKTTLQHIKCVLSAVFKHAKNEGAFDGVNPVQDARIPRNAREPRETFAYSLTQIRSLLDVLPLLPKAVIATASFAGLRQGELRGLEWTDYTGNALSVKRSVWKSIVNGPKTRASAQSVPVIRQLAEILDTYRLSMGNPSKGVMFHSGGGQHMDLYNLSRQIILPAVKGIRLEWYGWHACRRGIASNLFELGANEKVVQRILRHAKPHVTKERYIKAFDPAVLAAMKTLETTLDDFHKCSASVQQVN